MQPPVARVISPESASKVGAGALLLAVAIVELALDCWTAGWWQRSGALLVVAVAATVVTHGAAAILRELGVPQLRFRKRPERKPTRVALRLTGESRLAD